jgi:hypothetical protein
MKPVLVLWSLLAIAAVCLGVGCGRPAGQEREPPTTADSAPRPSRDTGKSTDAATGQEQAETKEKTPSEAEVNTSPEPNEKKPRAADDPATEAQARLRAVNDLKLLALALLSYQQANKHFPPADGTSDPAFPALARLSWRAHILPFMQVPNNPLREIEVFEKLQTGKYRPANPRRPSESWDRPALRNVALHPFAAPLPGKTKTPWQTYYRVFIGAGAAFEPKKLLTPKDFGDGLANTLLVVEAAEAVPWTKAEELAYDPERPLPKLGGLFRDGFYAAFGDARVRFIRHGTEGAKLRAWITRSGGEEVELPPEVKTEDLLKAAAPK